MVKKGNLFYLKWLISITKGFYHKIKKDIYKHFHNLSQPDLRSAMDPGIFVGEALEKLEKITSAAIGLGRLSLTGRDRGALFSGYQTDTETKNS